MGRVEQSSLLAQSPNRPVWSPKTRPTWATSLPDTCSVECLNGRTRRWCVATMHRHRVPSSVLHTDACPCPPEWMVSSPFLPGVLSRPRSRSTAPYCGNAATSAMAADLSSHQPQCLLLHASPAQAKHLSACAVSSWLRRAPFPAPTIAGAPPPPGADRRRRLLPWLGRHGHSSGHPRRPAGAWWSRGAPPTTPSPPTWPPFAGTGSAPASPLFPFASETSGYNMKQLRVPDAKPRLIWIVFLGCGGIHRNSRVPEAKVFSFFFCFSIFLGELWKCIEIYRKVVK